MKPAALTRLEQEVARYQNNAAYNDALHRRFTSLTTADQLLRCHRQYIETNSLGFGDDAFHYMWDLIVEHSSRVPSPKYLEIGVYKGQVVSLWLLLLGRLERSARVFALSPFCGNPMPSSFLARQISWCLSPRFREMKRSLNFYADEDYESICAGLFEQFDIDWSSVTKWRGHSSDPDLRALAQTHEFDIVYIDGDHTYQGALGDLDFYAPLLRTGGILVVDDSGYGLPGESFWKGFPSVSKAVKILRPDKFHNILNVGHNRVFERL